MPNRFNTPLAGAATQNYTSQFVGLPLEEMEAGLQASQNRYDQIENLGIGKKSELTNTETIGEWDTNVMNTKKKELDEFISQYDGKDLGSSEVASAFKQKINDLAEDPDIAKVQQFGLKYKQFKANLEKMKESGDYTPENIWEHQKALDAYSKSGEDNFNPIIEKGVNVEEEAEKYFKALHADSAEYMQKIADGQGGSIYFNNSQGGISKQKVFNQAKNMIGEFQKSAAGRQAVRRYQMESESAGKQPTAEGANQYLAQIMLKAGSGYAYSDSKSGFAAALDKKEDGKRSKKESTYSQVPFTEYNPADLGVTIDKTTGLVKGSGGSIERFNEVFQSTGSFKEAAKAWKDNLLNNTENPLTPKEKEVVKYIGNSYTELNKQRKAAGLSEIKDITAYSRALAQTRDKTQQLSVDIPMDEKEQKMYEHNFVESGAIRGMLAINPRKPQDKTKTVDQMIREKFDIAPDVAITSELMKEHNISIIGIPSQNGLTPRGFGLDIDGTRIIADMSASLGTDGNWMPKNDKDVSDINAYNYKQAELKGGTHDYQSFKPGYVDQNGQYIPIKARVVYDPETKRTFGRFIK